MSGGGGDSLFQDKPYYYHPIMKLWEGNVFTRVCLSSGPQGRGVYPSMTWARMYPSMHLGRGVSEHAFGQGCVHRGEYGQGCVDKGVWTGRVCVDRSSASTGGRNSGVWTEGIHPPPPSRDGH